MKNEWQDIVLKRCIGGNRYIANKCSYGYDLLHVPTGRIAKKHKWSTVDDDGRLTFVWPVVKDSPEYVNVKDCKIRADQERFEKLQKWKDLKVGDFVRISGARGKHQPWRKIIKINETSIYGQIARGPRDEDLVLHSAENAIWFIVEKA